MKTRLSIIISLAFSLVFTSCITNKQKHYLQEEGSAKMYSTVPFEEYRLCVNDEVIYYLMTTDPGTQQLYNMGSRGGSGVGQNSVTYRIYDDGCVVLPTLGRVPIAGLTLREAEQLITEKFKTVVHDPEVKLAMSNNHFYVQGDGGKGQFFAYKENLTIFQALALAGDISSIGDKKNIKIIRRGDDGFDHVETFDLRKESIIESKYYYVRPNDVIYIPTNPNSFFRVDSFSGFVSLVLTPLTLIVTAVTFYNNNK